MGMGSGGIQNMITTLRNNRKLVKKDRSLSKMRKDRAAVAKAKKWEYVKASKEELERVAKETRDWQERENRRIAIGLSLTVLILSGVWYLFFVV